MPEETAPAAPVLQPPAYHRAVVDCLKRRHRSLWDWFADNPRGAAYADAARLDLLKSTYRIEPADQPGLYDTALEVLITLGLDAPVTVYQARDTGTMNAGLVWIPGEIHIVLCGPVLSSLAPLEIKALLGHESAHYLLFQSWDREFHTAGEVLQGAAGWQGSGAAFARSLRLFLLHTEIFCDRGAYLACRDLAAAVTTLVKIETGLATASAENYLRQAAEIFEKSDPRTEGLTHPEAYLRARALQVWLERPGEAEAELRRILEDRPALDTLDLTAQERTAGLTRSLLAEFFQVKSLRSDVLVDFARRFFEDFQPADAAPSESLTPDDFAGVDDSLLDYYCAVLLDLATADRDLEDLPMAAAIILARRLDWEHRFRELTQRELKWTQRRFGKMAREAAATVAAAMPASS